MAQAKEDLLLESFSVFNIIPPGQEGADPEVYYSKTTVPMSKTAIINQVGLYITYINFCKRFNPDHDCDYICTELHEIGFLQLYKSVWMGISLKSTGSDYRFIMRSVLKYIRSMFSHFLSPLPELEPLTEIPEEESFFEKTKKEVDPKMLEVIEQVKIGFGYIVDSINWQTLDFTLLYNSVSMQPIDGNLEELKSICTNYLTTNSELFNDIVILTGHKVVYSTFNVSVTRALAFGMRKRYKHMYLHNPQVSRESLSWLIGLYTDRNGLTSLFQQGIYYDDIYHALLAFRYRKYKIVLAMKPDVKIDVTILKKIPKTLHTLRSFLSKTVPKSDAPSIPFPYACSTNDYKAQKTVFNGNMIDAPSRSTINNVFVRIQDYTYGYGKEAKLGFTEPSGFFVMCHRQIQEDDINESLVAFRAPDSMEKITDLLKLSSCVLRPAASSRGKSQVSCLVQ